MDTARIARRQGDTLIVVCRDRVPDKGMLALWDVCREHDGRRQILISGQMRVLVLRSGPDRIARIRAVQLPLGRRGNGAEEMTCKGFHHYTSLRQKKHQSIP
ncbi:MAG: hypothetical protein RBR19_02445 [Sedimentisphaerales bacterium]|jgi:hypothetical protein|nr:hypothetical protein [Planctomycetota bacterium]MDY0354710.1 hypothetical protein [Sedimentisphaerales bacterium]NLT76860.1 hypothetical protein [Planctomycetota bacterium]